MRHLTECLVVTAPGDPSIAVAKAVPGVRVFETDAFTRPDRDDVVPRFNKGLAMEEGFSVLGRRGHILIWDADVLFPEYLPLERMRPNGLHGARRRVLEDVSRWRPELDWRSCPLHRDGNGPIGFFQLFDAAAAPLRGVFPWYDVSFPHAGGCDAAFMDHFPRTLWFVLPMEVLHLGPVDVNWMGTAPGARDLMAKYIYQNQWRRAMKNHTPEAAARAGELPKRLNYPGYPESSYKLRFERAAEANP